MATEPATRPTYLSIRIHGNVWPIFIPTGDRLRMVNPSGQSPFVEWRWDDRVVGYGPAEDDS